MLNDLLGRMEKCVLRWFGHVEHMDGERIGKKIYDSGVQGTRGKWRPNSIWMDGVKTSLSERGWTLEQA